MPHPSLRLLVLTELFLPTKGGTAVWFNEVYPRLGGKGVHIVTASVPKDFQHDHSHANSVHRVRMQDSAWLRPASLPRYVHPFVKGLWLALRHPFDAVHAGRVLPEGLVGWLIARLIRRPIVIYAHGEEITTWRRSARRLKAMRFTYGHADRVIANSAFTQEKLLELGVDPERIEIINPGVDIERFHRGYDVGDLFQSIGIDEGQKLILSVGRLSRRKGFDRVVAALPKLVEAGLDVHYAVIGIGEDSAYLQQQAEAANVTARVHFLGHVSPADLPRWYCAAHVFAMPNRDIDGDTEGFGMVFVEAAACGTPSIAGRAGGTGGAVIDGITGLRVEGAQQTEVTEALGRLLSDPDLVAELGANGEDRARRDFSWEAVAERTARLHAQISKTRKT